MFGDALGPQGESAFTPTDKQTVARMNRDTYYSLAIVDVSKGATLTLPSVPEGKYILAQAITENHRIYSMFYGAGNFDLTTHVGTHVFVGVRLDSTLPQEEANEIQDMMRIEANRSELFQAEPINEASFIEAENELEAKWRARTGVSRPAFRSRTENSPPCQAAVRGDQAPSRAATRAF